MSFKRIKNGFFNFIEVKKVLSMDFLNMFSPENLFSSEMSSFRSYLLYAESQIKLKAANVC